MTKFKAILHHLQRLLPFEIFILIVAVSAALLASLTVKLWMILINLFG
ncbi:hypothetical protein [Prosthecobacter sp.]